MRERRKLCYDCKDWLKHKNQELLSSNMSHTLQPTLPPSTSFSEAIGNFTQSVPIQSNVPRYSANPLGLSTQTQQPGYKAASDKGEASVVRDSNNRIVPAGVRAGAHVRDLESHGVLPFGNNAATWGSNDASQGNSEGGKLKKFEKDSETDYLNWVKTKEKARIDDISEKQRVRLMQESYNPWGKPGAGAPRDNPDHRKNKFTEADLGLDKLHKSDQETPYYKTGGGAANFSKSGKVRAGFQESQDIRFSERAAKDIENKFRYSDTNPNASLALNKNQLSGIPEAQAVDTSYQSDLPVAETSIVNEMLRNYPYATAADSRNFRKKEMLTRNKKPPLDRETSDVYDPWGKGFGAPNRDGNGNVRRYKFSDPQKGGVLAMSNKEPPANDSRDWLGATIPLGDRGGAGAPRNTKSGNVHTRYPQTLIRNTQGDNEVRIDKPGDVPPNADHFADDPEYHPWGRPGGGAPARDRQGQPNIRRAGMGNRVATGDQRLRLETKKSFLKEQEKLISEQKHIRQLEDDDMKSAYGDLASKMNSGLIGRPKRDEKGQLLDQHLPVSDVTAHSTSYKRVALQSHTESKSYLTELEKQAQERKSIRDKEFQRENKDYANHVQTFDQMWGRPGHGAPLAPYQGPSSEGGVYKKKNLIGSLYSNDFMKTLQTTAPTM